MSLVTAPRIIVALDGMTPSAALQLAHQLDPKHCRLKVGKELFTRAGPSVVESLQTLGFHIFLDLKFHDIPTTVAHACRAAADLGVWMVNVHALGGQRMLEAARAAVESATHKPLLIGVTVLTSMADAELSAIGLSGGAASNVLRLADLCRAAALDGVVCSAQEAVPLRAAFGSNYVLVTPGIRPAGAAMGDQQRVVTPRDAINAGVDYLVIGRPITQAVNPASVLLTIEQEISDITS